MGRRKGNGSCDHNLRQLDQSSGCRRVEAGAKPGRPAFTAFQTSKGVDGKSLAEKVESKATIICVGLFLCFVLQAWLQGHFPTERHLLHSRLLEFRSNETSVRVPSAMYDLFDLFDGISFDGQAVDASSWVLLLSGLMAVLVAHRMLRPRQHPKLLFVAASMLSLGIPSVVRLFFDQVLDRNRLALFVDLYPDFVTNCFLLAACAEILIMRRNAPRKARVPFEFVSAITIPLAIWRMSHLGGLEIFRVLIGAASCLALCAICATSIVLRLKNRQDDDNYPLLTAGLFGVFIATNLMRFMPAAKLTVSQIETVLMIGSMIALASIAGLCLLLEGNNGAFDRRLHTTSVNDYE